MNNNYSFNQISKTLEKIFKAGYLWILKRKERMIRMNKYEFNVNLFGKMTLEVFANSEKEAEKMVQDLIDNITVKDIELKENKINEINIKESEVDRKVKNSRNKERERWEVYGIWKEKSINKITN